MGVESGIQYDKMMGPERHATPSEIAEAELFLKQIYVKEKMEKRDNLPIARAGGTMFAGAKRKFGQESLERKNA